MTISKTRTFQKTCELFLFFSQKSFSLCLEDLEVFNILKKKWGIVGGTALLLLIVIVTAVLTIPEKSDETASKSDAQMEQKKW